MSTVLLSSGLHFFSDDKSVIFILCSSGYNVSFFFSLSKL